MARPKKPTAPAPSEEGATLAEVFGPGPVGDAAPAVLDIPADEAPTRSFKLDAPVASLRFKVLRASRFVTGGMVHHLAAGSIVSAVTHDMDDLLAQQIPLEPV